MVYAPTRGVHSSPFPGMLPRCIKTYTQRKTSLLGPQRRCGPSKSPLHVTGLPPCSHSAHSALRLSCRGRVSPPTGPWAPGRPRVCPVLGVVPGTWYRMPMHVEGAECYLKNRVEELNGGKNWPTLPYADGRTGSSPQVPGRPARSPPRFGHSEIQWPLRLPCNPSLRPCHHDVLSHLRVLTRDKELSKSCLQLHEKATLT